LCSDGDKQVACVKNDVGSRRGDDLTFTHDRHNRNAAPGADARLAHGLVLERRVRGDRELPRDDPGDLFMGLGQLHRQVLPAQQVSQGGRFVAGQRD
jgi:hypothetical protein